MSKRDNLWFKFCKIYGFSFVKMSHLHACFPLPNSQHAPVNILESLCQYIGKYMMPIYWKVYANILESLKDDLKPQSGHQDRS